MTATAEHRPAVRRRRFRHDDLIAVEAFSGFGGLTQGIEKAGFTTIMAANHNRYKVKVHEANHPDAEHWVADLVDPESGDYHDVRDLPAGDIFAAGVSCTNHSQANTKKAYRQGLTLFNFEDEEYEARVTRSERDRATANCVLHYAQVHHPRLILVECTTELASWGPALPGRPKVGDGSTYRWWLREFDKIDYRHQVIYLNSMFFDVPQSRDRLYIGFSKKSLPKPDLDHRPPTWCWRCDRLVEAVWSWKTGVPPTGSVRYGKQYNYRCPSCRTEIVPPMAPSLNAIDLTDLGIRIGDKPVKKHKDGSTGPLAAASMARAQRCLERFGDFPAVLMPAKSMRGVERHPWQPMATQTSQQETALLSTGAVIVAAGNTYERNGSTCRSRSLDQPLWAQTATATTGLITPPVAVAVDNYQGAPRSVADPLPTQGGSETFALVSAGVLPYRKNTVPAVYAEAMPTVTAEQIPALLTAQWRAALADVRLEDCFYRMMTPHEIGRGCGFDVNFPGYEGSFIVWGSNRDQVDGYGNAVSPPVGEWIGSRLRAVLHAEAAA